MAEMKSNPANEAWLVARLRRHLGELVRLASPIVISRLGILLIVTADVAMVGRVSVHELAIQALGMATIIPLMLASIGMVMGTLVVTANAFGADDYAACGATWRRSMVFAFGLGLIIFAYSTTGEAVLILLGIEKEMAVGGGRVMFAIGIGLPAQVLFMNSGFFLEAIRRPLPGMSLMIAGNILNIGLNWLLIFGNGGFDPAGAEGAAWATTAVRWFMALGLMAYVWWMPDQGKFAVRTRPSGGWRDWPQQRRIGYATGISIGVESTAFASLSIYAGWMGAMQLGAYTISHNLLALVFMMALGLGAATSVRVGIAHGRRDARDLMLAGWSGLGLTTLVMAAGGGLFVLFPDISVGIYTDDAHLVQVTIPLLVLTAVVLLIDGGQSVLASALRGRQDVWLPTGIQIFAYVGVLTPAGYVLGVYLERGARGLLEAILLASVVSVLFLGTRFHALARRDRKDMA